MKILLKLPFGGLLCQQEIPDHHLRNSNGRFALLVSTAALLEASRHCHRAKQKETGGIVIGYYDTDLRQATVIELCGLPSDSRAGKTWFHRGTRGLFRHLQHVWDTDRHYYLGERHRLPRGHLLPSPTDETQMAKIAADPRYLCPEPLLLMVRPSSTSPIAARGFIFSHQDNWQELVRQEKLNTSPLMLPR